ncbi:hypothetical protein CLV59_101750 [Chitinophaga dinghuensis]|uniref:CYTH domain-containing protein n=1 Tax=Chitinophaga dinghuensis TaxID=1539050 RepID=A0A327WBU1_9BACT|nr:hypothetical protein [Chitinophaga dinghuensis]RAJ87985.1 hypothetical protein CLV59_101750 [Chitinophaga dinghuensis]
MQTLATYRQPLWQQITRRMRRMFQLKTVYRSQELRWFFTAPDSGIQHWFSSHGRNLKDVPARTDIYFYLPENNHRSIKLRDGNMELKRRCSSPKAVQISPVAAGLLESWEKLIGKQIPVKILNDIDNSNNYFRIRIQKQRVGVKVVRKENATYELYDLFAQTEDGCQLEYTKLEVEGQTWYTFAAEWFGNAIPGEYAEFLSNMLHTSHLPLNHSMAYPAFIRSIMVDK